MQRQEVGQTTATRDINGVPSFREFKRSQRGNAHRANHDIELKSVVYLADHQAARFAPDTPIAAVILPKVVDGPKTTWRRAKPMEAMLALAPTSIIILPEAAPKSLDKLSKLVTTAPAFWLELGHDVGQIEATVRQICQEMANNG